MFKKVKNYIIIIFDDFSILFSEQRPLKKKVLKSGKKSLNMSYLTVFRLPMISGKRAYSNAFEALEKVNASVDTAGV